MFTNVTEVDCDWGSYRVTYAYSKALDDVGEFFFGGPVEYLAGWGTLR